jgi:hypothetical protein
MDILLAAMAVALAAVIVWLIRRGPPDSGVGPQPPGDNSWLAGG